MRRMIMLGLCSLFALAVGAQGNSRVQSGTPLRWSMNGSIEIMEGDLARYYGSTDTASLYRQSISTHNGTLNNNPHAARFASAQAICDDNSVLLNWVAVQQYTADRYQVEQSSDGRNWVNIGMVPANRTDVGEASYRFHYTGNASNVQFRIAAISTTGERIYSPELVSPCSNNTYLGVVPNPVYSTATVRIGTPGAAKVKLMLLNTSGMVVQRTEHSLLSGMNQVPLDMSSLPRGYYTLVIHWRSGKQDVIKMAKQ